LEEIASKAEKSKLSQLKLVEKIVDNLMPDTKPPVKKKLTTFVKIIRTLRDLNEEVFFPLPVLASLFLMFGI
jgi:DNA helicase-2/ATP-dependent DNA helicase PcrA